MFWILIIHNIEFTKKKTVEKSDAITERQKKCEKN